jgi:hypothetical protein
MTSSGFERQTDVQCEPNGGTSDPRDVDDVVDDLKVLKWPARSPADPCASRPPDNYGASANHAYDARSGIGTQN